MSAMSSMLWANLSGLKAGLGTVTVFQPDSWQHLQDFLHGPHSPVIPIGRGTNLIGSDDDGLTVLRLPQSLCPSQASAILQRLDSTTVMASAALPLSKLLVLLARQGLGGYHRLAGIPGSLGGALTMNAGALGQQIQDVVHSIHGLNLADGSPWAWHRGTDESAGWGYRTSPVPSGVLLTHAVLCFQAIRSSEELESIRQEWTRRSKVTPAGASIGSIFRNPPGDHAGRLLEAAGCQSLSEGPFSVSLQHANWLVNLSRHAGSAHDALGLIQRMQAAVCKQFGIELLPECRVIDVEGSLPVLRCF